MQNNKLKKIIILCLKIIAIEECLTFVVLHYFFEIKPFTISPIVIVSFLVLFILNYLTKNYQKKDYFKISHIPLVVILLFFVIHLRAGIIWALNTFPLNDANMVLLTLQEPFDDFAYLMVKQYLETTIPQTAVVSIILLLFVYVLLNSTKKRLAFIGMYFITTIVFVFIDIPVLNYIYILSNEPEKQSSYSKFFVENYVNPDSVKITLPEEKRNLILIYLESLETTFADKEHGGNQDSNLIPEITELAKENISFGKHESHIGGGLDASGSTSTFTTMHTRSLGIPHIVNYRNTPILHYYKSFYKILNENGYKQIFFQGNPGLYNQFRNFVIDQKVDEVYGPEDLIERLDLDVETLIKNQGYKTVQDKDAFKFATTILDTISEPFSLTFFTIDTHAPHGMYDPDCIKIENEKDADEQLKVTARCVSRELDKFLISLKSKTFYENTSIVIFGDHRFMGTRLVKDFPDRKWVNIFINVSKIPSVEEKRRFSDIDMFPTILSAMGFSIKGNKLGLGTDLFSEEKTLVEKMGLDSLNKEIDKISGHLVYESYLLKKNLKEK
ncbi:MAG: LTA synthase family protein [Fibrobacteraceae bacterium]|nr:LTA synthase family protein [Fibrobacteraceae bacterium]